MEEAILLRFVGLIALFAAISILTVGSLTLTQNISNKAFAPDPQKNLPYQFITDTANLLREKIHNYSNKIFRYYLLIALVCFLPVLFPFFAQHLGGFRSDDGFVWIKELHGLLRFYPLACLGFVMTYTVYIVRQIVTFKSMMLRVLDE